MEYFDKQMALDVIEDALADMDTPHSRGLATGLCGAFYLCGLLSEQEWAAFLERIPAECRISGICEAGSSGFRADGRVLN